MQTGQLLPCFGFSFMVSALYFGGKDVDMDSIKLLPCWDIKKLLNRPYKFVLDLVE